MLHLLIIFKNGFQLLRNANYPKNNYFVTSLLLVYLMDVQMLYSHYFIAPVMVDLSVMDVQQSCTMGTAWYISLHMVSLMDVHRTTVWRTAGTLVYIRFAIRSHLFAIRSF